VNKLEDQKLRGDMMTLYSFGFVDYDQNFTMMNVHKDVEVVAANLCEGLLSKSIV